jgi:prolyl-tRNA editing enzyme YbaK/EbsC (Cys-tRNA(Pro) deacylase)
MEKHEIIQNILKEQGIETEVFVFSETTRTSQDAADQVGCQLGQIAKSIIFRLKAQNSDVKAEEETVLAITSGPNRVSGEKLLKEIAKQKVEESAGRDTDYSQILKNLRIEKADADFVYEKAGFPIGGVPPFGHKNPIKYIFIDEDLMQYETIWCAAGTPFSVFEIIPKQLVGITNGVVSDIREK